ncbi:MAG: FtsX-like permease family protein [Acidobacteriota bacterium]
MLQGFKNVGPILRAMMRNKIRVFLLAVEIAVTVAVVLNCSLLILQQLETIRRPTGIVEDELIAVVLRPYGASFTDAEFRRQTVDQDLEAIRALPGVVAATPISNFPLIGGGSALQARPLGGDDSQLVRAPQYSATPGFLETLGLDLVAGRRLTDADLPVGQGAQSLNVMVTQELADALFPDGDALGQTIDTGSAEFPDVIVGIVSPMFTPYGGGPMETRIMFFPGRPSSAQRAQYLVRAEPGAYDDVFRDLDATFLKVQPERLVTVRTMDDIRAGGFLQNVLLAVLFSGVAILLIFVTGLGIFGVTAFAVAKRTKQIGTRRALGATKDAILSHFLIENTLITLVGLAVGLVAAFGLNVIMVSGAGAPRLGPGVALIGAASLWVLVMLATWFPARRASALAPALATRTV